ncbi:hypothetical protein MMPV_000969 [Pyropia vietnamensis]
MPHFDAVTRHLVDDIGATGTPAMAWTRPPIEAPPPTPPKVRFSWARFAKFVGPGFLVSVAFIDPGNIECDLQAGARYGYALLWVLLSTTAAGFVMQTVAAHVGIVAGRHLAALAGEEYPPALRTVLFVAAQASILAFDVAEVVGTAVALRILTGLPLVGGMVVSAVDTAAILYLQRYGLRAVEWVMEGLLALILVCVVGDAAAAGPDWAAAAWGAFVPTLPAADGVVGGVGGVRGSAFLAVSLLGAVVMPHNAFLHSGLVLGHREEALADVAAEILAGQERMERGGVGGEGTGKNSCPVGLADQGNTHGDAWHAYAPIPDGDADRCGDANATAAAAAAARVAAIPAVCTLATLENGLALTGSFIANGAVLSVAASQFFPHRAVPAYADVGLADASALLSSLLPTAPRTAAAAWGIALLLSGHCATVTGTMASAYVCEGFLPGLAVTAGCGNGDGGDGDSGGSGAPGDRFWRGVNLATRAAAILPALGVAVVAGERGADALIVGSQVVISFALPFAIVPLLRIAAEVLPGGGGSRWLRTGWATAAIAVAGNVWLVVDSLSSLVSEMRATPTAVVGLGWARLGTAGRIIGGAASAAALVAYMALVGHLVVRPMSGVLRRGGRGAADSVGRRGKDCLADTPAICYGARAEA